MLEQLSNYIQQQKLFQQGQKIVVAVSGGVDSVVMSHLFKLANINYVIAHCNFQLRGVASDMDEQFVRSLAKKQGANFHSQNFETKKFARLKGISVQMAARELRKTWFEELIKGHQYDFVATAHHLNDSLETTLFNLAKGTGIQGLKGITPKNGPYIRPLLFATREMILDYANVHNLSWREDSSNKSTGYHRNLIRHKVIPELKKINPNLEATFAGSQQRIAAAASLIAETIGRLEGEIVGQSKQGLQIDKSKLNSLKEPILVLYEIIRRFGFNLDQVSNILKIMDRKTGKRFYSATHQLVIDRNFLFLFENAEDQFIEMEINEDTRTIDFSERIISFEKVPASSIKFHKDNQIMFVDFKKLTFPLSLRSWLPGDQFQPLGMQHKKKLSDFMIDEKIPLNLKKRVLVIAMGFEIVCVVGHRIDERFKVTTHTQEALMISSKYRDD